MDLGYKLSSAVAHYKDRMVRGLGAMCDDEKQRRIAEFIAANRPENGTVEQMEEFSQRLWDFKKSLHAMEQAQHTEGLIDTSGDDEGEESDTRPPKTAPIQVQGFAGMYVKQAATSLPN